MKGDGMEIVLRDEYIKLGQALKAAGLVESGVMAKDVISDGLVKVNGVVEYQRGKKLHDSDVVFYNGEELNIITIKTP
jgi:ribosome-associated protein